MARPSWSSTSCAARPRGCIPRAPFRAALAGAGGARWSVTSYELQVTGYELQALVELDKSVYDNEGPDMKEEMMDQLRDWYATSYKLQVTSYKLQVTRRR